MVYVAVNLLFQLNFVFPLFWGIVMYANEFETKEKQKLTEIKNKLQHIHKVIVFSHFRAKRVGFVSCRLGK